MGDETCAECGGSLEDDEERDRGIHDACARAASEYQDYLVVLREDEADAGS
jgi:hypothetical protein